MRGLNALLEKKKTLDCIVAEFDLGLRCPRCESYELQLGHSRTDGEELWCLFY